MERQQLLSLRILKNIQLIVSKIYDSITLEYCGKFQQIGKFSVGLKDQIEFHEFRAKNLKISWTLSNGRNSRKVFSRLKQIPGVE